MPNSPLEPAALRLAASLDWLMGKHGPFGPTAHNYNRLFWRSEIIRRFDLLYDAETDTYRQATPPAPDLSELEREYLEACYAAMIGTGRDTMTSGQYARRKAAFEALHAARTRSAPDADALERARDEIATMIDHPDRVATFRLREVSNLIIKALAERTRP